MLKGPNRVGMNLRPRKFAHLLRDVDQPGASRRSSLLVLVYYCHHIIARAMLIALVTSIFHAGACR
jgi:hypothetical protein